jgi:hypothetical protein
MATPNLAARERALGRLPLMTFVTLAIHIAEEWPAFPEWATRHFGTTTRSFYVVSHIPLLAIALGVCACAGRPQAGRGWIGAFVAVQWALATNAAFHVLATVNLGEYSPGLVSAVVLYLPMTVLVVWRVRHRELLSAKGQTSALVVGVVTSLLAVSSLWLDFGGV